MLSFTQYPTFVVFLAVFLGAIVAMALMPVFIKFLRSHLIGQQVRADGPESHLVKQGTPTMGGIIMLVMVVMAAITFRAGVLDAAIISAAIAGCCIGFLWFNSYPADIFMGDTGSLALGTALGCLAIVSKTEVLSLIIGGLFVVEALSVIIQVLYFKKTRKRLFLMAPLHHHFEKKGWSEVKVVIRFWIISAALAAIGFCLYFAQSLMG